MMFVGGILFCLLMGMQYLGYDSIYVTAVLAGIVSGTSVVVYPRDDDEKS
ncbi:MAG TPA: hypothetical protein PKM25_14985 [Candidatus Ozemobacteraceae bacterium]|nr:hypothetical protein [Candidatus Ozemobacteraceae bacterium]